MQEYEKKDHTVLLEMGGTSVVFAELPIKHRECKSFSRSVSFMGLSGVSTSNTYPAHPLSSSVRMFCKMCVSVFTGKSGQECIPIGL